MRRLQRDALVAAGIVAALATLSACAGSVTPQPGRATFSTMTSAPAAEQGSSTRLPTAQPPIAITHIHAVARHPRTGDLLLATHEGLFRQIDGQLRQTGPVIDLMSFAVASDGTFYASGHPGTETDLPQPVGLITSTDGGATWQVASRGGQSDFHALTVGAGTVTGFDGALRTTTDNTTWTQHTIPAPPRDLAAAPRTGTLLATTSRGLFTSTDNGTTWTTLSPPEVAVLAAWADDSTAVIVTTTGRLATSTDSGRTWTLHPKSIGAAEALHAQRSPDGQLEIIAVVGDTVIRTMDAGASTQILVQ
ncbi:F510_1955 family glycosylhydrolase [Branchiibius sp. NY16-3462-2]|uniref:F510_1955 family glycosylhydrolase n=1 Tax=Branchiibius sp. NY16-3462-2 TaxID=1807500 RepID=UPI000799B6A0|nr:hypothetical protein [Branchiibius sp. NY16-3462-2]KYH45573.1 hypothetical protein AZH51_15900 [Branchiibius sp. NY16-3462-2]